MHKGNTGYLKRITGQAFRSLWVVNSVLYREKLRSQDPKPQLPQVPDPRPLLALPSMLLALDKDLHSFSIYKGFRGKSWISLAPHQETVKRNRMVFEKVNRLTHPTGRVGVPAAQSAKSNRCIQHRTHVLYSSSNMNWPEVIEAGISGPSQSDKAAFWVGGRHGVGSLAEAGSESWLCGCMCMKPRS